MYGSGPYSGAMLMRKCSPYFMVEMDGALARRVKKHERNERAPQEEVLVKMNWKAKTLKVTPYNTYVYSVLLVQYTTVRTNLAAESFPLSFLHTLFERP
jgi:hypothetical protein